MKRRSIKVGSVPEESDGFTICLISMVWNFDIVVQKPQTSSNFLEIKYIVDDFYGCCEKAAACT